MGADTGISGSDTAVASLGQGGVGSWGGGVRQTRRAHCAAKEVTSAHASDFTASIHGEVPGLPGRRRPTSVSTSSRGRRPATPQQRPSNAPATSRLDARESEGTFQTDGEDAAEI